MLELAAVTGTSVGTIAGFGGAVTNVGSIAIDSGAAWQVSGIANGFSNVAISGFDGDDSLVLTDFAAVSETFDGSSLILTDAGANQRTLALSGTFTTSGIQLSTASGATTISLLCFCRGTRIATPSGEIAVHMLRVGDSVLTRSGQVRPIAWIGNASTKLRRGERSASTPVLIRQHAFAPGVPYRDLRVTKGHAVWFDGVLIPAEFLVNNRSIVWDDAASHVEIFHIELDAHDVVLANGAPAESYRDDGNRALFATAAHDAMPRHPPCAPVLTGGPEVDAVWARLLARSGQAAWPMTEDPDLHLVADGLRLDPIDRRRDLYVFRTPAHARLLRIVSRAAVPVEHGGARDARPLGVALRRVVSRRGQRFAALEPARMTRLRGFHPIEHGPDGAFCWTDGDAPLPGDLPAGEVFLHVQGTTRYPLAPAR